MTNRNHLTEEERQGAADRSLDAERLRDVEQHMASCDACARDVASLRMLMSHVPAPSSTSGLEDLWPSIRSRIDEAKVVSLDVSPAIAAPSRARRGIVWIAGAIAAALAIVVASLPPIRAARGVTSPNASVDSESSFINVTDSTSAYEAEANALLNQLEMQRAMLPPEARTSVDHDLRVIDGAIAEIKDAIAHDPNNPALRRLLASSYRQKVELLKRASGAG